MFAGSIKNLTMKVQFFLASVLLLAMSAQAAPVAVHGRIIFVRDGVVWTIKPDGTEQKRVYRVPKNFGEFGGFSSDEKRALCVGTYRVYEQNLLTKGMRQVLVYNGGFGTTIKGATYSPDNRCVLSWAFNTNNNSTNSSLWLSRPSPKFVRSRPAPQGWVKPQGEDVPYLNWSDPIMTPDGKQILAVGGEGYSAMDRPTLRTQTDIWIMDSSGQNARRLVQNDAFEAEPALSPDGKMLAFVRSIGKMEDNYPYEPALSLSPGLWLKNMGDGTEKPLGFRATTEEPITGEQIYEGQPVLAGGNPLFSPDGKRIAFQSILGEGIEVIDVDGKNHRKLCQGTLVQWMK